MNPSLVEDTHAYFLSLGGLGPRVQGKFMWRRPCGLWKPFPQQFKQANPKAMSLLSPSPFVSWPAQKKTRRSKSVVPMRSNQFAGSLPKPPVLELKEREQWNWLKEKVLNCETSPSQLNPNAQVVFGTGNWIRTFSFAGKPRVPRRRRKGCPSLVPRECWADHRGNGDESRGRLLG